ncbi:unnamed protein product [Rhizophagus irregularis]|nr:unnamed protein product [Rhizophagus irregularis]
MNTRSNKKNNPPSSSTNVKNNKNEIYKKMPNPSEMYYNSHQTPHNTYNEDYINEIAVQLNSSLDNNSKLEAEARKLRDELDKYKLMCDKYKEKYMEMLTKNNEETNQRDVAIRTLKNEIMEREQRLKDVQRLENRVQNLEKKKKKDEASSYQSALGVATNFQLGDNDQNNAVNLNEDLLELNDNIKKYVTNLKQDIVVNTEEVKKLLLHYNCPTRIQSQKEDRLLIQAVLHRHVIEKIFEYASQYFQSTGKHYHLESDITKMNPHYPYY